MILKHIPSDDIYCFTHCPPGIILCQSCKIIHVSLKRHCHVPLCLCTLYILFSILGSLCTWAFFPWLTRSAICSDSPGVLEVPLGCCHNSYFTSLVILLRFPVLTKLHVLFVSLYPLPHLQQVFVNYQLYKYLNNERSAFQHQRVSIVP